jgi:fatty-acyl-CoA synthase
VTKSGSEWICSIEIENVVMRHPAVAEAAVIGLPYPKPDERPPHIMVRKPDAEVSGPELRQFLTGKIGKW